MQFRHLRYFVKIVEAGSFSRAATTIHVAQPALSQQIHELEERMGLSLLQRSARGVRPTPAGEVLYREASAILRQLDQLPGIVRSAGGEPEGMVRLGLASSLAPRILAGLLETCRSKLPKVTVRLSDSDSGTLEAAVRANSLDLALMYEDEFVPAFQREPLFRQRMYLIAAKPVPKYTASIPLQQLANMPLVLPSPPNARRLMIDRQFAAANIPLNLVTEADTLPVELSAVRAGVANTILPTGEMSSYGSDAFARPLLIEPAMFLTCSVIASSDFPLTQAGDAVRRTLVAFMEEFVRQTKAPGVEWIAKRD
jgi:LysR family nitrogen assimilation transcriptional regulator